MKCFVVVALFVVSVSAGGNGAAKGISAGKYSGGATLSGGLSRGAGNAASMAGQVIPAAIQTVHNIEYRDVPSTGSFTPTMVEVGSQSLPLMILFRSSSSALNVQHAHNGGGGDTQESQSEDEPHRLVHSVTKPIIQEVHEVITPFRKITQEIQPVQEEIETIVARNVGGQLKNVAGFSGSSLGLGGSVSAVSGKALVDVGLGGSVSVVSRKALKSSDLGGSVSVEAGKALVGADLGAGLNGKSSGGYSSGAKLSASTKSY